MSVEVDRIDRKILTILQQQGRISNQDLADLVGISTAACWRREKALRERGLLRRYVALVDPRASGLALTVFLQISMHRHGRASFDAFEEAVRNRAEVLECHAVAGDPDFLLKVLVPDMETYDRFLEDFLFNLPEVAQVRSNFALRELKYETALPLDL